MLSNIPDPAVVFADSPGFFLFLCLHDDRFGAKSAESKWYWKRVEGGSVFVCLRLCPVSDLIQCRSEDQLALRVPDLICRRDGKRRIS